LQNRFVPEVIDIKMVGARGQDRIANVSAGLLVQVIWGSIRERGRVGPSISDV